MLPSLLLLLWSLTGTAAETGLTMAEFSAAIPHYPIPTLALLCDLDAQAVCDNLKASFEGLINLKRDRFVDKVQFVFVQDHFLTIMRQYSFLPELPRLQYFDVGGAPKLVPYFQTTKQAEFALERFLSRVMAPAVVQVSNPQALSEFLRPSTDELRDFELEDPVSFLFVEHERGSSLTRSSFYALAKQRFTRGFFAHLRLGEFDGDWLEACHLSVVPLSLPAIIRFETNREPQILSELTASTVLQSIPPRLYFPTELTLGAHNFREVWETSQSSRAVMVMGLFHTPDERSKFQLALSNQQQWQERFWLMGVNCTTYGSFLAQFIDDNNQHAVLALNRSGGTFWLLTREEMETDALLTHWLGRIERGEELPWQVEGLRALPRLWVKAVQKKPQLLLWLVGGIVAVMCFCLGFFCLVTAPGSNPAKAASKPKTE